MKLKRDFIKDAAEAHTDLNVFASLVSILEGGHLYESECQRTAQRIIALCKAEETRCLKRYDKARAIIKASITTRDEPATNQMGEKMSNRDDGGAAFPKPLDPYPNTQGKVGVSGDEGMSLRDYFAAQALTGLASRLTTERFTDLRDKIQAGVIEAGVAYTLADAMLAVRSVAD